MIDIPNIDDHLPEMIDPRRILGTPQIQATAQSATQAGSSWDATSQGVVNTERIRLQEVITALKKLNILK